jgi:hypothetical protein
MGSEDSRCVSPPVCSDAIELIVSLDDRPQAELLKMLFRVRRLDQIEDQARKLTPKAFVGRLPPLQDLSAHHASSDHSVPESGAGTGENFREGMEGDERECESPRSGLGASWTHADTASIQDRARFRPNDQIVV